MFLHSSHLMLLPIITLVATIAIQRDHLLMILLTLEAISLLIIAFVSLNSQSLSTSTPFLIMYILTMAATEAGLGLSLLVVMARQTGSDNTKNLTALKC